MKKQIFKNEETRNEMLTLRQQGWSVLELAKKFSCDHTTILYQIRKEIMSGANRFTGIDKRVPRTKQDKHNKISKKRSEICCDNCGLIFTSKYSCKKCENNPKKNNQN